MHLSPKITYHLENRRNSDQCQSCKALSLTLKNVCGNGN